MQRKHKTLVAAVAIVLLFLLAVPQLQAQAPLTLENLAARINTLARRVTALGAAKADKSQVDVLENRVATLEARLRPTPTPTTTSTPTGTPTPVATSTPTPTATDTPEPTATPTPSTPFLTTRGTMNIRGGPGTNYAIVGNAAAGTRFDITGKNAGSDWWRIDYRGQHAWIYAPLVTATNVGAVSVVLTPAPPPPPPTPQPAAPAAPPPSVGGTLDEQALFIIHRDSQTQAEQQEWNALSDQDKQIAVIANGILISDTASYCDISTADAARMVDRYAQVLDDAGYTARQGGVNVRFTLMLFLTSLQEADRSARGCEDWLGHMVNVQLANE